MYSIEKHVQLVKLPTRSQTRRVKLYSIEGQNQVDFCCLICFSFVTAVLEKQIQKECDLRNRVLPPSVMLPPFVSDCALTAARSGDMRVATPRHSASDIRRGLEDQNASHDFY
jgi:hypothetical protein